MLLNPWNFANRDRPAFIATPTASGRPRSGRDLFNARADLERRHTCHRAFARADSWQILIEPGRAGEACRKKGTVSSGFADEEDASLIAGDGSSSYSGERGLLVALGSAGVFAVGNGDEPWSELSLADIRGCAGKLPSRYNIVGELAFFCSSEFFWQVTALLALVAPSGCPWS